MPRFVVLQHETPEDYVRPTHWDFMLEHEDTLWVWALPEQPKSGQLLDVTRLRDHRLMYLDYEGPISSDRGSVQRWDAGDFSWLGEALFCICVELRGDHMCGIVELTRRNEELWQFLYNEERSPSDGISLATDSEPVVPDK